MTLLGAACRATPGDSSYDASAPLIDVMCPCVLQTKVDCAVIGATAAVVAPPILAGVALKAVGFAVGGPLAGSYAAAWMSSAVVANGGAVAATSTYSAIQSYAMTAAMFPQFALVVGVGAGVYGVYCWRTGKRQQSM